MPWVVSSRTLAGAPRALTRRKLTAVSYRSWSLTLSTPIRWMRKGAPTKRRTVCAPPARMPSSMAMLEALDRSLFGLT